MFIEPELEEVFFEVAGITWFLKDRPHFEVAQFLLEHEKDPILGKIAARVFGIKGGDKFHPVNPIQAREVISKLTTPQLIELDTKYLLAVKKFHSRDFKFDKLEPLGIPHWKKPLGLQDRLAKKDQALIDSVMKVARQELAHPELTDARVLKNYEIMQRGMDKVKSQMAEEKEAKVAKSYGDLYAPNFEDEPPPPPKIEVPERTFALLDLIQILWPVITLNLYTLQGTWAENNITLRYVNKKELLALNQMYHNHIERERIFCALSITSVNNEWCLSSLTQINPLAVKVVDTWTDDDMLKFYSVFSAIRKYLESCTPYIEALPFTKLFRDFWDVNKHRANWWVDSLTGIPGTGQVPPSEHIDLFAQECLIEERAIAHIEDDDRLSLQVAGMSHDLAQSIQTKNVDLLKARGLQINYMLFNEIPVVENAKENQIAMPGESSREEIISVAESMLKGNMDYHDMMLALLRQRKEAMEQKIPAPVIPPPSVKAGTIEGGTHYGTIQEVQKMQQDVAEIKAAQEATNIAFSNDLVQNIAKARRRRLLIQGQDPYHDTDQSTDLGSASNFSRDKNYRT